MAQNGITARVSPKKFFRDPVHGTIVLEPHLKKAVLKVIDTPQVQRLRRISHLGMSPYTFPGAEHSRFGHAMGAMFIMSGLIRKFRDDGNRIAPTIEIDAVLAALLHDVGHGPFSHLFEEVTARAYDHEKMGRRLILESPLRNVLARPRRIVEFLDGRAPPQYEFVSELLDGPIDVDKMDYLLRDSLYAGVEYGRYDYQRLFHTLCLYEKGGERHIGVLEKGKGVLESFILARDQMFWSVYFHKTTRGVERLVRAVFLRVKDLMDAGNDPPVNGPLRSVLQGEELDTEEIEDLDDVSIIAHFKRWRHSDNPILSDLASRLFRRDLFKMLDITGHEIDLLSEMDTVDDAFEAIDLDRRYYLRIDRPSDIPYSAPYFPKDKETSATVVRIDAANNAELREISEDSVLIQAIKDRERKEVRVYSTSEGLQAIREILDL